MELVDWKRFRWKQNKKQSQGSRSGPLHIAQPQAVILQTAIEGIENPFYHCVMSQSFHKFMENYPFKFSPILNHPLTLGS